MVCRQNYWDGASERLFRSVPRLSRTRLALCASLIAGVALGSAKAQTTANRPVVTQGADYGMVGAGTVGTGPAPASTVGTGQHTTDMQVPGVQTAPAPLPAAPSATARPLALPGGFPVQPAQPGVLPLTLDQAIQTGLKNNTQVLVSQAQGDYVRGETLAVLNNLLPSLELRADSEAQEINLAALGFKPSTLSGLSLPGFNAADIASIVKVNTTQAQLQLSQTIFSVPAFFLYKAAKRASEVTTQNTLNVRGGVVLAVGGLYLRILADQAQIQNAQALVKQDQVIFDNARARRDAGVGINLDVLRAQVQLQNEQQELVRDINALAKDKIALDRQMGISAGQQIDLVDTVPFAEYQGLSLEDAVALAYTRRKDLLSLQAQLAVATETARAVKYERLPTLGIGGFYGVLGETTGLYHGVFAAGGKLSFPIFDEGQIRGQQEVAAAQVAQLRRQIDGLKPQIEADIRASLLDVQSAEDLVKVAQSSRQLAQQELDDASARFVAGVDDDLPVVRAQASLQGAEANVVQAEFQFNFAKLNLARNTGVVETEFHQYLGS